MLEGVAVFIEGVQLGHIAPRPVGREVAKIFVCTLIFRRDGMELVVLQPGNGVDGHRVAEVFPVGHLELATPYTLQELTGTGVAELTLHPDGLPVSRVRHQQTDMPLLVQQERAEQLLGSFMEEMKALGFEKKDILSMVSGYL